MAREIPLDHKHPSPPGTSLVDHARRELDLAGWFAKDPVYAQATVAAVAAFASYDGRHYGTPEAAVDRLATLLRFGTLTPLTGSPDEWMAVDDGMWQSRRNPQAFSTDGGRTFYLLDEVDEARRAAADAAERPMHTSAPARAGYGDVTVGPSIAVAAFKAAADAGELHLRGVCCGSGGGR